MVPFLVEGKNVRHPALRDGTSSGIFPLQPHSCD
jgi:hypothetical protein